MSDVTVVTDLELLRIWMGPDAVGLVIDEQQRQKIVTMSDGRRYAAPLPPEPGSGCAGE